MRIDSLQTQLSTSQPDTAGNTSRPAAPATGACVEAGVEAELSPADRLTELLRAVKELPDVRADVLRSVADLMAAGDFNSPEAAVEAANNLLSSGDLPTTG